MRILIADDHAVVRSGLRAILGSRGDWEICAEAESGNEAVVLARQSRPDVAILDLSMPGIGGLEAAAAIRKCLPDIEFIILTCYDSRPLLGEIARLGVLGFVLKSDAGVDLIAAVEAVQKHEPYISGHRNATLPAFVESDLRSSLRADGATLTKREREEVKLIAKQMRQMI